MLGLLHRDPRARLPPSPVSLPAGGCTNNLPAVYVPPVSTTACSDSHFISSGRITDEPPAGRAGRSSRAPCIADTAGPGRLLRDGTACRPRPAALRPPSACAPGWSHRAARLPSARRMPGRSAAASGSERKLCSVHGRCSACAPPITPPMMTSPPNARASRGSLSIANATFVNGPIAIRMISPGCAITVRAIRSAACSLTGASALSSGVKDPLTLVTLPVDGDPVQERLLRTGSHRHIVNAAQRQQFQHHAGQQPRRRRRPW